VLNRILISTSLALCVAACSTPRARSDAARQPPSGCIAETATRIPVSPHECAGIGHVWTDKDIKSTGATSAGEALRQLDPTVIVTGH
jgi:hypothetical protein